MEVISGKNINSLKMTPRFHKDIRTKVKLSDAMKNLPMWQLGTVKRMVN